MSTLRTELEQSLGNSYRVVRELGGGGMSRVFLAEELALGREVVIKVLAPELGVGVNADRFRQEMQLVARLQHAHIVPVLSSGTVGDLAYYVMPFINGESLRTRLDREGALPIDVTARILRDVADALSFAHGRRVIHRDVKPGNVLLADGHALVTDFGVAKALGSSDAMPSASGGLTSVGESLGTPTYIAPEQAMADPNTDDRADVYAFGVMAYEMLAGEPPFVSNNAQRLIAAHLTQEPVGIRTHRSTVPEPLEQLVMRCLAKRPADRPQRLADVLPVLDAVAYQSASRAFTATETSHKHAAQVLIPLAGGTLMLATAWALRQVLGLPNGLFLGAVLLVLVAVPVALLFTHRRRGATGSLITHAASRHGVMTGALVSVAGLAGATALFFALRAAGIGPFATLLSAGTLVERDRILVSDFHNATGDTLLGPALAEALRIDLSQSKVVRLMSPADVRDGLVRMNRDANTRITPEVAIELAARGGAKVVIAGDIVPVASGYGLSARILDAQGATLFATRESANTAAEILAALDKVSRAVRGRIGESLREIRATQPLEEVSTSSLEALQLYTRAVRAQAAGEAIDRLSLLRQAVALDSNFAMAWRAIYIDLNNLGGDQALIADANTRTYNLRHHLPAHEALLVEAAYATYYGDFDRSIEVYRRIVASWPDDIRAQNNLGHDLRTSGRYEEAERVLSALVASGLANASAYYNLITTQIPLGRFDDARQTLLLLEKRFPRAYHRLEGAYFIASSMYRFDEAMAAADSQSRAAEAGNRFWGHMHAAEASALRGQLRESERHTLGAVREQLARNNRSGALREQLRGIWIALQLRGDSGAARRAVDAALAEMPFDSLAVVSRPWGEVVRLRAALGQLAEAHRLIAQYGREMPKIVHDEEARAMARGAAQLALAERRYRDAITSARHGGVGCDGCTGDLVGEAFEGLGQVDSAIVAYERARRPPTYGSLFLNYRPVVEPRAMFRLGELYEKRGDRQLARDRYAAFVDLWQHADPDLQPAVLAARERLAKLSAER